MQGMNYRLGIKKGSLGRSNDWNRFRNQQPAQALHSSALLSNIMPLPLVCLFSAYFSVSEQDDAL